MAGQYIPLPELAPPIPKNLTAEQCVALWAELYDAGEKLLLAGLRLQVGPDGDVFQAYRDWLKKYYDDHDQILIKLATKLYCDEEGRAR